MFLKEKRRPFAGLKGKGVEDIRQEKKMFLDAYNERLAKEKPSRKKVRTEDRR